MLISSRINRLPREGSHSCFKNFNVLFCAHCFCWSLWNFFYVVKFVLLLDRLEKSLILITSSIRSLFELSKIYFFELAYSPSCFSISLKGRWDALRTLSKIMHKCLFTLEIDIADIWLDDSCFSGFVWISLPIFFT